MKRFLHLFIGLILTAMTLGVCFAEEPSIGLRDYDGIELPRGTFIPVMNTQEVSTVNADVGTKVKFISTNDLYLYEKDVLPKDTEFYGYVEKVNEPVVGTNGSMVIKLIKLRLIDGFEIPIKAYIYTANGNLIGGELTEPAKYDKMSSFKQGFYQSTCYMPGATRLMGEHTVITSGAEMMLILASPVFITHTVTN